MKREILEKLIEWKNREDRKPLVLTGAVRLERLGC